MQAVRERRAEVLNELGKFVPAIGTTMFGGPLIGAAVSSSLYV